MPPESWLLIAILGVIIAHGCACAYRLAWTMMSDVILLVVLTGSAMAASYLFG
jgi:presenilin-like A22 family membrane protease